MSSYIKINIKKKKKVLSIHHDHNHASVQSAIRVVKSQIKIKEIAKDSGSTPSQIFNKVINSVPKSEVPT